jgi:hypothetical protein
MDKIEIIEIENSLGKLSDFVIIDHGNGSFTSMPKVEYDKQQAEQSTPSLADEAEAK